MSTKGLEAVDHGGASGDLYAHLHRLAAAMMQRERHGHTLQPTALIHEMFLRLDLPERDQSDERRLLACAARIMRQVLVDHARRRGAAKRGGDAQRVALDTRALGAATDSHDVLDLHEAIERLGAADARKVDVLDLHEAIERLGAADARKAAVVDLKFFGQMTHAEIATELGVSAKTVESDWYFARAWLRRELDQTGE